MTRGYPDYVQSSNKFEIADIGNIIYATGDVIYKDRFEEPVIQWNEALTGDVSTEITTDDFFSGCACLKVIVGPTAGSQDDLFIYPPLSTSGKTGIEVVFCEYDGTTLYLEFRITLYIGIKYYRGSIRYNFVTNVWQYESALNTYSTLSRIDAKIPYGLPAWAFLKLIIDPEKSTYFQLRVNDRVIGMQDLSLVTGVANYGGYSRIDMFVTNAGTDTATVLFDNVTLSREN